MDMPTPKPTDTASSNSTHVTLNRLAQSLGCSPERFFEAPRMGKAKETSQLVQMWLAIKKPEGREAVFAFASEVLKAETRKQLQDTDL